MKLPRKTPRSTARMIVLKELDDAYWLLVIERWRRDSKTGEMLHYYSIPGGGIEAGEMPEDAALREIYEETQLRVTLGPQVASVRGVRGEVHHYFLGLYNGGEPQLEPASPEAIDNNPDNYFLPKWLDIDGSDAELLHPKFRRLLPLIRRLAQNEVPAHVLGFSEI